MDWQNDLAKIVDTEGVDLNNEAEVISLIFNGFISPEIRPVSSKSKNVYIPEQYVIKLCRNHTVIQILTNPDIFNSLPYSLKLAILDILYLLLRRSIYDTTRAQAGATITNESGNILFYALIKLLENKNSTLPLPLGKRVVLLMSCIGLAGVDPESLRDFLLLLRYPSEYSTSLLQAMHSMIRLDTVMYKALPSSFFNFGGLRSGLFCNNATVSLPREYQFFTWFRVESFDIDAGRFQHLFSLKAEGNKGLDIFIEDAKIGVSIETGKGDPINIRIDSRTLQRGVWYHLSLRHAKPRLSLFGKDELTVTLDLEVIYQEAIRYPNFGNSDVADISCGKNFNGQMTSMYFLSEVLPSGIVEQYAKCDAGKPFDEFVSLNGVNNAIPDLISTFTVGDKKFPNSKFCCVYHPRRCVRGFAVDIHGNHHCVMGNNTYSWYIRDIRDVLNSLGGITVLMPLFPRLFVEFDAKKSEGSNGSVSSNLTGLLGTSLGDMVESAGEVCESILDEGSLQSIQHDRQEIPSEGCISLLVSIISKLSSDSKSFQKQLQENNSIEMMEYVLRCVPSELLQLEGETCALAMAQMRSLLGDNAKIDVAVTKSLLCNFEIWSRSSYQLQCALMAILIANVRAQPAYFLEHVGVQGILHGIYTSYMDIMTELQATEGTSTIKRENSDVGDIVENKLDKSGLDMEEEVFTPKSKVSMHSSRLGNSRALPLSSFKQALNREIYREATSNDNLINEGVLESGLDLSMANSEVNEADTSTDEVILDSDKESVPLAQGIVEAFINNNNSSLDDSGSIIPNEAGNNFDDDVSQYSVSVVPDSTITREQRKYLRECLETVVMLMALYGSSEKEITPIVDFIASCRDKEVLVEFSQMLLTLVMDGGAKVINAVTNSFKGTEEFASFVLFNLIHHRSEDIRCIGIKLLTHYYLRFDLISGTLMNTTLKRKKGSILIRAIEKMSKTVQSEIQGLERLRVSGGLALLSEIVGAHRVSCTDLTYSALLEMLLLQPGTKGFQGFVTDDTYDAILSNSSSTFMTQHASTAIALPQNRNPKNPGSPLPKLPRKLNSNTAFFAASYLRDVSNDNLVNMINATSLPMFLDVLPKLPLKLHLQIYSDFLALLKHSSGNRNGFSECPLWHTCLFNMISQLLPAGKEKDIAAFNNDSKQFALSTTDLFWTLFNGSVDLGTELAKSLPVEWSKPLDHSKFLNHSSSFEVMNDVERPLIRRLSTTTVLTDNSLDDESLDMIFAIGLKVYSTLLLHSMDNKNGWRDISITLSQFSSNDSGKGVALTTLSHLINELAFSMRSKYRDLQRLAKSTVHSETTEAMDKLENILSILLISSQFILFDHSCAVGNLVEVETAKLRMQCHSEVSEFLSVSLNSSGASSPANSAKDVNNAATTDSTKSNATQSESSDSMDKSRNGNDLNVGYLTEEKLISKLCQLEVQNDEGSQGNLNTGGDDRDNVNAVINKFLEFSHHWIDLVPKERMSGTPCDSNIFSAKNPFNRDQVLHPLERGHSILTRKLVLVLQTLRFFDSIFWPNGSGPIRNANFLKFQLEKFSIQSEFAKSNTSSKKQEPATQGKLSIYGSAIRMCLYVLQVMSPFSDLTVINLKRLKALVEIAEKVPKSSTPVQDWMLAVLVHVTTSLQRVGNLLMPLFTILGIQEYLTIPKVGVRDEAFDNSEIKRFETESNILETFALNSDISDPVWNTLTSASGKQLLDYIQGCFEILALVYDECRPLLEKTIETKTVKYLEALIRRYKIDTSLNWKKNQSSANTTNNNTSSSSSFSMAPKMRSESFNPVSDDNNNNGVDSTMTGATTADSTDRFRLASFADEDSTRGLFLERASIYDNGGMKERTSSFSVHLSADDYHNPYKDMMSTITWVRAPYFRCDALRSILVIRSMSALENHELTCNQSLQSDLDKLKTDLDKTTDQASSVVSEIMELKELSGFVLHMLKTRENNRKACKRYLETLRLKNVASAWQDCIHQYEADWSPWFNEEHLDPQIGRAYVELSRHLDMKLRRNVFMTLPEPIDHSDAAYTEGKLRDQLIFEATMRGETVNPSLLKAANNNENQPSSFLKPDTIRAMVRDKRTGSNWGEADDVEGHVNMEDVEDEAVADFASVANSKNKFELDAFTSGVQSLGLSAVTGVVATGIGLAAGPLSAAGLNLFSNQMISRPMWAQLFEWDVDEKILYKVKATQIMVEQIIAGELLLTNKAIYFHPEKQTGGLITEGRPFRDSKWSISRLIEVYGRRYLLQNSAIELFFLDLPEVFIAFNTTNELQKFYRILRRLSTPLSLSMPASLNPRYICSHSPWTELWKKRVISNFEYLMRLNIIAGRSFNDITQYPVFPWIIADYVSDTIDLRNEAIYRDLSKPVGALNEHRLKEYMDRYRTFDEENVPKFMYGSHYSSAGVVMHYLIRQEPFTTMAINLQGGRFDCPDRIFFNLKRTWQGCNNNLSDVKELIPELFCCPEMLMNSNKLPLGELQEGSEVNDVILPPWAKDAFDFIRINREALESDFVSDNLHNWIDLIFGYKQVGQAAIDAKNVFYYLTYENAVNIDAIEDPLQREAAKAQVIHFGQCPSQLFSREHPKRLPRKECWTPLCSDANGDLKLSIVTPPKQMGTMDSLGAVVAVKCVNDKLVAIHSNLFVSCYRWSGLPDGEGSPFQVRATGKKQLSVVHMSQSLSILKTVEFSMNDRVRLSAVNDDNNSELNNGNGSTGQSNGNASTHRSSGTGVFSAFRRGFMSKSSKNSDSNETSLSAKNKRNTQGFELTIDDHFTWNSAQELLEHGQLQTALILSDSGYSRVISIGYWDNSIKVHSIEPCREIVSVSSGHGGQFTCVQSGFIHHTGHVVITGDEDGLVRVWILEDPLLGSSFSNDRIVERKNSDLGNTEATSLQCISILNGHFSAVTALHYNSDLDLVFSASESGLITMHSIRQSNYIKSIRTLFGRTVTQIYASSSGYIVVHSSRRKKAIPMQSSKDSMEQRNNDCDARLDLFWMNGELLTSVSMEDNIRVECFAMNLSSNVLVCGHSDGSMAFRKVWNLELIHWSSELMTHGCIKSLNFTDDAQFLMIGCKDGSFSVASNPDNRWEMLEAAMQKSPIMGQNV